MPYMDKSIGSQFLEENVINNGIKSKNSSGSFLWDNIGFISFS